MRLQNLEYKHDLLVAERVQLSQEKQQFQSYLSAKDEIDAALNLLAENAQSDAIALYSELLTKLVCDVMGKEQQVVLETQKLRDKVHLNIYIIEDGNKIDILEGKGGSVCNIIAVGMRIVSLIQSPHRRFLFLDEPDCWLAPHLVHGFVNILKKLCADVGLQVIYISHHSEKIIGDDVMNVHLDKTSAINVDVTNEGKVSSGFISPETKEANSGFGVDWIEDQGIRNIALTNFMSHTHTVIPLSADMTLLTGTSDIGKSTVFRALKALVDNDPRDTYIKHNEATASVRVELEYGTVIEWSFSRKKSVKPCYVVTVHGKEQVFECKSGTVPSFIVEAFNFGFVGNFDLHFADQKDPLFILHSSVKGYDRAQFLALSDNFDIVMKMTAAHKQKTTESRAAIKMLNKQLDEVNDGLRRLKPLPVLANLSEAVNTPIALDTETMHKLVGWLNAGTKVENQRDEIQMMRSLSEVDLKVDESVNRIPRLLECLGNAQTGNLDLLSKLNTSLNDNKKVASEIASTIDALTKENISGGISLLNKLVQSTRSNHISPRLLKLSTVLHAANTTKICGECGQLISEH